MAPSTMKLPIYMDNNATTTLDLRAIEQLRATGLSRLAVSLDGVDAATHDGIRGVSGVAHHRRLTARRPDVQGHLWQKEIITNLKGLK